MSNHKVKIIIAETQFLLAEGLKAVLNNSGKYLVTGIADTYPGLIKLCDQFSPDLAIIDIKLIEASGIGDFNSFIYRNTGMSFVMVSNLLSKPEIIRLIKEGFKCIIYKTADGEEVINAVESALKGKKFFSEEILDLMVEEKNSPPVKSFHTQLTTSETEIVKLISNGLTTKEIAAKKNVSFHTVNTHRKNIFRKLGISNSSELIMQAIKAGWIDNIEYYI